jgi:Tol biopolymer transport system component
MRSFRLPTSIAPAAVVLLTVADVAAGQGTIRVSVSSAGAQANGRSGNPVISADGRYVAFESEATNLVANDVDGYTDVFVHDLLTHETTLRAEGAAFPSLSADGRFLTYTTLAGGIVANDTNGTWDTFVHDRETGEIVRVSVDSFGNEGHIPFGGDVPHFPSISADGRVVAFQTMAGLVQDDANGAGDVYLHDRLTGETIRASVRFDGSPSSGASGNPFVSGDGRYVAFDSTDNEMAPGDTARCTSPGWRDHPCQDVYVFDRITGRTVRESQSVDGGQVNGDSWTANLSANGRYLAFSSRATNLVSNDTPTFDLFVRDRWTGTTTKASVDSSGVPANGDSSVPRLSADGHTIVFRSEATNLVPGVTPPSQIYCRNLITGTTTLVSVRPDGTAANNASNLPSISRSGRYVSFVSFAMDLVPDDTNYAFDVFVRDRGAPLASSVSPSIGSADGGEIARLYGAGFQTDGRTIVRFGDAPAEIVDVSSSRVTVRTPPGVGTVDVALVDSVGATVLADSYTYVSPDIAARYGNVGVAIGDREDVLLVNGSAGDPTTRATLLAIGQPIDVVLTAPSSRTTARFAIYVWSGAPTAATLRAQPRHAGSMVFPTPLNFGSSPQPVQIGNGFGDARLGAPTFATSPAPTRLGRLPHGIRHAASLTLQGFVEDDASQIPQHVSITNAVIVLVWP